MRSTNALVQEAKQAFEQAEFNVKVDKMFEVPRQQPLLDSGLMTISERVGLGLLRLNDVIEWHYLRQWKKNVLMT